MLSMFVALMRGTTYSYVVNVCGLNEGDYIQLCCQCLWP